MVLRAPGGGGSNASYISNITTAGKPGAQSNPTSNNTLQTVTDPTTNKQIGLNISNAGIYPINNMPGVGGRGGQGQQGAMTAGQPGTSGTNGYARIYFINSQIDDSAPAPSSSSPPPAPPSAPPSAPSLPRPPALPPTPVFDFGKFRFF
jgi:hypothetical protein